MSKNTITINYTNSDKVEYRQTEDNTGIIEIFVNDKYLGIISTALLITKMQDDKNLLI